MMRSMSRKEPYFIFTTYWYIEYEVQMYLRYERMYEYDQHKYLVSRSLFKNTLRTLWRLFTILLGSHQRFGMKS